MQFQSFSEGEQRRQGCYQGHRVPRPRPNIPERPCRGDIDR